MRRNLSGLSDEADFNPYCLLDQALCDRETALWNSENPRGAILALDLNPDDGSVICTEYNSTSWYFSTLEDPWYGNHPVSGTREFGYERQADGSYDFYVRGVDRMDSYAMGALASGFGFGDSFSFADQTWENFQQNLADYINDPNGNTASTTARVKPKVAWRADFDSVEDVLMGKKEIKSLDGCD
ncbi:hypothetical protein [Nonlabens antarcticus]|uniref:hypothetical protein n=1 Tax=Nonlabens antarcticus TaxID=392714 RepID=UPI0018918727|nr:hypothetical protein [Nonlabens antarcticus]